MDSIEFQAQQWQLGDRSGGIRIRINGTDLVDLLRQHESLFANAEGHPSIAGGYTGLPADKYTCPPSRHFLGEALNLLYESNDGRIQVLQCPCGEPGCWPLLCRIVVSDQAVVWSDFEQPHRAGRRGGVVWSYDGFGPFVFDRDQYMAALHELGQASWPTPADQLPDSNQP